MRFKKKLQEILPNIFFLFKIDTLGPDPDTNWTKIQDPDPNSKYLEPQHPNAQMLIFFPP